MPCCERIDGVLRVWVPQKVVKASEESDGEMNESYEPVHNRVDTPIVNAHTDENMIESTAADTLV